MVSYGLAGREGSLDKCISYRSGAVKIFKFYKNVDKYTYYRQKSDCHIQTEMKTKVEFVLF